jgi:UDP-N-acetyl-2-amino-2-deoxyglucuronate dehydrogenase
LFEPASAGECAEYAGAKVTLNFAITGAGGFVAPRHLKAIRDTGNTLVAALDPKDSVGVLDQFSYDVRFFTEFERFDRHLEKLRRLPHEQRVHWLSVCSPNHLHDAQCRLGLRVGANVLCEKPLVLNPWNLDALAQLEGETGKRVHTVLQLRHHPMLIELRERLAASTTIHDVELTYVTARGPWYDVSWKGQIEKSGGVGTNIGIHFFDLLVWLFGEPEEKVVHLREPRRLGGSLRLARARVRWFMSVDVSDVPETTRARGKTTHRVISVDGQPLEFSEGFADLHTRVYAETLAGRGFGIEDARGSITIVEELRRAQLSPIGSDAHPALLGRPY